MCLLDRELQMDRQKIQILTFLRAPSMKSWCMPLMGNLPQVPPLGVKNRGFCIPRLRMPFLLVTPGTIISSYATGQTVQLEPSQWTVVLILHE